MRNGALDRAAQPPQAIGQIVGSEGGFRRHHAAADVDANSGGNYCPEGRYNAANGRAFTQVHIGHDGDVLVDEWHARGIGELELGRLFDRHASGPHLDGPGTLVVHEIVIFVFHIRYNLIKQADT